MLCAVTRLSARSSLRRYNVSLVECQDVYPFLVLPTASCNTDLSAAPSHSSQPTAVGKNLPEPCDDKVGGFLILPLLSADLVIVAPYPYVWFTPVVLIGGLIATGLIAFLSVATLGYETVSTATSHPNVTSENRDPFSNWPSFLTANTKSICSATTITIGTGFYTNNTALKYTITKIWRGDNPNSPDELLGSLPYLSNPLENCAVSGITIGFEALERSSWEISQQKWSAKLKASISYQANTPGGRTTLNMTTTYNYNGIEYDEKSSFSGRNETTKASLWWGEPMLARYSIALTNDMHFASENIKALDFFQVSCFFVTFNNNGVSPAIYFCDTNEMEKLSRANESDSYRPLPDSGPNILDNVELWTQSTSSYEVIRDRNYTWGNHLRVDGAFGLADRAFTGEDSSARNLRINPSVISTTLVCQIPRLKSTPSLVASVIINTLVILSTLWKLYKFIIDAPLPRRHPEMMNCAGYTATMPKEAEGGVAYSSRQSPQSMGMPSRVKSRYSSIRQEEDL
ncbi:uncharacterized protein BKA55DRAFT_590882 [Fusarium redolens]|uniref:Uncharacterized protein n=1 Tax=Fusarium redolens TaxID=48865 RepID=A0A9P9KNW2_FUSRE|nr:uncharacterized protein BKA55DRAFT_590882 [Fusarium redolens]KAH7265661.1 hypothetical protein BKA55DRAFT_590882 [Fusarium redolens]